MTATRRPKKKNAPRAATLEASKFQTSEDPNAPSVPTEGPARNPDHLSSRGNPDSWDGVSALSLFFLAMATRIDGGTEATSTAVTDCARCGGWDALAAWAARGLASRVVANAFVTAVYDVFLGSPFVAAFGDVVGSPDPGEEADALQRRWCAEQPSASHGGHADAMAIVGTLAGMMSDVEHHPPNLCLFLLVHYLVAGLEVEAEELDLFGRRLLEELALAHVLPEHVAPRAPARAA